ncbi:MAG: PHP domain-containing protein [Oscillospiraceae bacterium]|nr:PHP domain-containing protein [Oscillospiraceae bacterium]MCL2125399.1 PHP domain-containing protein [Oscillospiraceae bacterium]
MQTDETIRMRIDLHTHTRLSNDGRSTMEELAAAASAKALDALVITDHNACALDAPVRIGDVWLFPGCEISTDAGHILGLFLDKMPDIAALRSNGLPKAADAVAMLKDCGAVTVLAHPFANKSALLNASADSVESAKTDTPVDCVESVKTTTTADSVKRANTTTSADSVKSANTATPAECIESANARAYFKNTDANAQAGALAFSLARPQTGGSDAHCAKEVGNAYALIDASDASMNALREAILNGSCVPVIERNTPRRLKGFSQFRQSCLSRNPLRILKGMAYIGYCIVLDIIRRPPRPNVSSKA